MSVPPPTITVYGTPTCADCRRSTAVLNAAGVPYEWVDMSTNADATAFVLAQSGRTSTPYIVFPDGASVTEPSDAQLRDRLRELGLPDGS